MKKITFCSSLISLVTLIPFAFFSSCKSIQPVSMGGVETPKLHKLSREGIEAEFGMKIKNPNNTGITVFPSEFDGTINDISVGKIKLHKKVKIKANSDETENFHIKSDFSKVGFSDITKILPVVTSGKANLYLKGEVKVGKWYYKKKFPIELKKTVSLSK